jgi:GTP-binding protein
MGMNSFERYRRATFLTSVADSRQLPADQGTEIAIAGRSNSGKSSALNALTGRQALARVSKIPGRTQMINFFQISEQRYLVDLPGYGYARVGAEVQRRWQRSLEAYLAQRRALVGLVLLMDVRHPATELDCQLLDWSEQRGLPCHILLTKCDKVGRGRGMETLRKVQQTHARADRGHSIQLFSATKKVGLDQLAEVLDVWFGWD